MKLRSDFLIIDFDSTIVKLEGLEELARICLKSNPNSLEIIQKLEEITRLGMEGELPFGESLKMRLKLFPINRQNIQELVELLKDSITLSFLQNKDFLQKYKSQIYVISGGFKDWIDPVIVSIGLNPKNVFANTFLYNEKCEVIGIDTKNVLSQDKGKVKLIKKLKLKGDVVVIGDGYNDYQIKESGYANKFFAFTENIHREVVVEKADHVVSNFEQFIFINNY